MTRPQQIEYWDLTENPTDHTYQSLMKVLCDHSDTFYFITRKELSYDQNVLAVFQPHIIQTYQTKEWANTLTLGPPATAHLIEANEGTCKLLQQLANGLYDWVAPRLPEDLTFIKNNFTWFSSTTHEECGGFSIRSDYYRRFIHTIPGLKVEKVES
ncbi:hypothetical protein HF072_05265 [Bacillus sp. RO3]|nr:hypothetical protein [Bacillus sp. RO3]